MHQGYSDQARRYAMVYHCSGRDEAASSAQKSQSHYITTAMIQVLAMKYEAVPF
jgi:hypothetical protein